MAKLDPERRGQMMRTFTRRAVILVAVALAAIVASWSADESAPPLGSVMEAASDAYNRFDVTGYQAAWAVLTLTGVIAVYWWGVGTGSRYEPPPVSTLRSSRMLAQATEMPPSTATMTPDSENTVGTGGTP